MQAIRPFLHTCNDREVCYVQAAGDSCRLSSMTTVKNMVGYIRVSTEDQAESGLGLASQRTAIEAECVSRGWNLIAVYEDALSGRKMERPGLQAALYAVENKKAEGIVVAKLDRLSRSMADFAALLAQAQAQRWNLVALDLGIDLSTPSGEFMANVLASIAQWERKVISQRTKEALAAKRAQGVRLGRPIAMDTATIDTIMAMHRDGRGLTYIANQLNEQGIPTTRGGKKWYPSTVRAAIQLHK